MTLSAIRLLAPQQSAQSVEFFCQERSDLLTPFSPAALEFVETLSRQLLRDPAFKAHPEMIALGYGYAKRISAGWQSKRQCRQPSPTTQCGYPVAWFFMSLPLMWTLFLFTHW